MDAQRADRMASSDLIQQALALPNIAAQKHFLEEHAALLDDECAETLKKQADHFLRADVQRSLATAELLLYQGELTGNPLHRALGLLAEANARSIGLGEYESALNLYSDAAHIYHSHGRFVEEARSQVGKIGSLANLGRFDEALETGTWASRVLEEHGQWQVLAGLTVNMAIVHGRAGDDVKSLETFDRAQKLYEELGAEQEPAWLWVQMNRGIALRNLGRFEESLQVSQAAWQGQARLGQQLAAARAQQSLGCTYLVLGRYNEALEHLDQVRDIFLDEGCHRDAMLVELFISDCLLQLRRFSDVLEKCRHVRELFAELGADHVVAQAIVNEAVAFTELDRYAEALASLAEAREIFQTLGNRVLVASTDLERAVVLLRQGYNDEGLAVAQECAAAFRAHILPVQEAQAHLVAARAALAQRHHSQALRLVKKALEIGELRNVPTLNYQGYYLWGDVALARGDRQDALTAYDRAIQNVERLRGRLMVEFRADFLEDKETIYQDVVGLCLDLDKPHQGLEYAERAKSRALLDMLAHRLDLSIRVRVPSDRQLVEELNHLRRERDRLSRRWETDEKSRERGWMLSTDDRRVAQQEVLDLEKQITDKWHRLLVRNADYAREASLHTVHIEHPQPHLPNDALLLEYFVVHGKPIAFLVTAEDVQAHRLDRDLATICSLMQLLWLNLRAVPRSTQGQVESLTANAKGLLQQIHQCILNPLTEALNPYRKLILVPHGPLHYLPFHALYDGTSYLLERFEICYLPGSSFLRYCKEAEVTDSGSLSIGHSDGSRLPYAVEEARSVAALLDGQTLLEDQITLTELQRTLPGYRTLHLAAHGDFRPDNPLFSGLAISDGWLTTLDIFNLRLRASLVTLSACQTGRNVVSGGDELLGLMRAFLGAGAASLVLSLWAVEDRSTSQLMASFYRKLARGATKGEALRQAQLRFVQGQDGPDYAMYRHPYFWAPFFLVGNAGPL